VDVAPTYNALASLASIADAEDSPGISDWSVQVRKALSTEEWETHQILVQWIGVEALSNVTRSAAALADFPTYIQTVAAQDPARLRDTLVRWIAACPSARLTHRPISPAPEIHALLASEQALADFYGMADKGEQEVALSRRTYRYLTDPPALQALITAYLDRFWQAHLYDEWEHVLPILERAVDASKEIATTGMSHFEAIEAIARRNLRGVYRADVLGAYSTLRFIPTTHSGPYILKFGDDRELRIAFGAHRLRATAQRTEAADTTALVDRLKALGDETRLKIVQLLSAHGELGTQEIIEGLDLSKSAASRHLRQLYATAILDVRVDQDGIRKYYRLNPDLGDEMFRMLSSVLG
jgi:DNA-binding transcriptional ArsR family regulator